MLGLYNTLLHAALLLGLLAWPLARILRPGACRGLRERLTAYPPELEAALEGSRPIWIHAASVGEARSAAPLVRRMRSKWPQRKLLVSTVTATGRQTARDTLPEVDGVTYLPLDLPWLVGRSLRRFRPELVILLETELWPNFIRAAHNLGIPTLVLSGRLSYRSAQRYKRFRALFGPVLDRIAGFGMQDDENAGRVRLLGVDPLKVTVTGSLKGAGVEYGPLPELPGAGRAPVIVAGSTHRGEEAILLDVLPAWRARHPDLLLILAPRHPERFDEVERLLRARGWSYRRRSGAGEAAAGDCAVLLLDTLGELPRYYGHADVAFVGGSLVPVGGHNLMEPARWARPVLFGPHCASMSRTAQELLRQGGGLEVRGREDLLRTVAELLSDRPRAQAMGRRARQVADAGPDALSGSMRLVCRQLGESRSSE